MIRAAVAGDDVAMGAILSDWIDATPWMPRLHTRADDRGFCRRLIKRTDVRVADLDDRVVGFVARDGEEIPALYVAKTARGNGIGAALLQVARDQASSLSLWTFQANEGAQLFYTREGFAECQRTDGAGNAEGLPDVQLTWSRSDE